jgi:hypothetical protein
MFSTRLSFSDAEVQPNLIAVNQIGVTVLNQIRSQPNTTRKGRNMGPPTLTGDSDTCDKRHRAFAAISVFPLHFFIRSNSSGEELIVDPRGEIKGVETL